MKRMIMILVLAVVMSAVLPGAPGTALAGQPLMGKIKDVDTQEKSLVIGLKDQDKVVYLDQATQITVAGKAADLAALKVGMQVVVDAVDKEGESTASKVTVPN